MRVQLSEEAATHLEKNDILTKDQPHERIGAYVSAYEQKDSCSNQDLADNIESRVVWVLRDCNAECECRTTGHAKAKAE